MARPEDHPSAPETDLLAWMGTDPKRWAQAFVARNTVVTAEMELFLAAWFALAIKAGEHGPV